MSAVGRTSFSAESAARDEVPASEFDAPDFDARDLVQRYRKRVPLPQLQKALRAHHAATRRELVELINEKYADFVSLSSRMQGVERALKPLRAPLEESSELTKGLHSRLGGLLEQAEDLHRQLEGMQIRRDSLKTFIENSRLLDKARKAAELQPGNPQESDDALREHVLQENIARDLRRIRLNLGGSGRSTSAAAGAESENTSPECEVLLKETQRFEDAFAEQLRRRLHELVLAANRCWSQGGAEANAPSQPTRVDMLAIACVCRALVTLGRSVTAEAVFSEVFVRPALESSAARSSSSALDAGAGGAGEGLGSSATSVSMGGADLGPFFEAAAKELLAESSPFLWMVRRLCSHSLPTDPARKAAAGASAQEDADDMDTALMAVPSLQLISNAAAAPALAFVQKVWPNVFTPVFPDVFAANYMHAARFIAALQSAMPAMECQEFTQSPALKDFRAAWKTQVYYTLRSADVTKRLEAALLKAGTSPTGDGWVGAATGVKSHVVAGRSFHSEVSAELFRILQVVWSDSWYLETLFPKMIQLSLELLARYARALRIVAKNAADLAGAGAGSAWDAANGWGPTSMPVRLSRTVADALEIIAVTRPPVDSVEAQQDGTLASLALGRAPCGPGGRPWSITQALLLEAIVGLQPGHEALSDAMLSQVSAVVNPQFAAIASVPSMFRFLNKPVPTKASAYVESAIKPIRSFRDSISVALPADAVSGVIARAVDTASIEFATQVTQLLESLQKQMASLQRLAGKGDSQVTDLDKIHVQLCLDAETFTSMVAAMGIGAGTSPGLAKLAEAVEPIRHTYDSHRPPAVG